MSVFCPKCGKRTYDENKCDHCNYQIKPNPVNKTNKNITIDINKNKLITTAIVIITISLAYIAYSKYRENKMIDDAMETYFGTSDIKEINKQQKEMYKKLMEENNKAQKQMLETQKKLMKSIKFNQ